MVKACVQQGHHDRALESLTIANSPCQNYLNGRRLSGESRLSRKYSNVKYFTFLQIFFMDTLRIYNNKGMKANFNKKIF